jgi:hypothetical protein
MILIHILRKKADEIWDMWCPYCDEVVKFGAQHYYDGIWCMKCKRDFPPHTFPKGFNRYTGELKNE